MIASPADPVADATGPAFTAAVATPGWIGGAIAAPNSIEATSIEASSIDVISIDARLSAPVLGADTGATTTTLRVAAARPAARKERTDTVIEDFSLFITFAVGLCL